MKTLLEFLTERESRKMVRESFSGADFDDAVGLIDAYLKKKIPGIAMLPVPEQYVLDGVELTGYRWVCPPSGAGARIGWSKNARGAREAYAVDFFRDLKDRMYGEKTSTALTVYPNGASVALTLPLIVDALKSGDFDAAKSAFVAKMSRGDVQESFRFRNLKYRMIREDAELAAQLFRKKKSLQSKKSVDRRLGLDVSGLEADIARIDAALASGSEEAMTEVAMSFKSNVPTYPLPSPGLASAERKMKQAQEEYSDPKTAFRMLEQYMKLAIEGNRNGVLICGAPGVGKTYRVTKFLEKLVNPETGAAFDWADTCEDPGDIYILKGMATGAELYKYLWATREKGKVLLIDDCDSILTDSNGINLLKAALEGGANRLVSYAIKGKTKFNDPYEGEEIDLPKGFRYNGKIIILTNRRAGNVDTAIRSRVFIQDINFSVQSVLQIIEDVAPTMKDYSEEGKRRALDYLKQLADEGSDMEISLRTFGTCAEILAVVTEMDLAELMIRENMRLQFERNTLKY